MPAAVCSAHSAGVAFAAWLCKRAVFVAAHCESQPRAEPFGDDCRARSAGLPNDLRLPQAPFEGARRVVPPGSEVVRDSRAGQTRPVALDGTKIKANASKHHLMSYERMKKREAELKAEVACIFSGAVAADVQEDEIFGKGKCGD